MCSFSNVWVVLCAWIFAKKNTQGHFGFRKNFFRWNFSLSHRVKSNLQLLDNDQNSEKNGGRERSDGGDFLARTRPHIKIYLITFTFGYGSRWSAPAGGRCPRLVGRAAASERTTTACRPVHAWHWTARRGAFGGRSLVRSFERRSLALHLLLLIPDHLFKRDSSSTHQKDRDERRLKCVGRAFVW